MGNHVQKATIFGRYGGELTPEQIQKYRQQCSRDYKTGIGLPADYTYLRGNPVKALAPVETASGGVMVVGAYPSAKFCTVEGVANVPLDDIEAPFSSETYPDGKKTRTIPSGRELEESYLKPLGISRSQCWITNLVKVFLFQKAHVEKYRRLGRQDAVATRSGYAGYARKSIYWLSLEVELAQPRVIICLGAEVTAALFGVSEKKAPELMNGEVQNLKIGGNEWKALCFPHPGIVMRKTARNPWPEELEKTIIPAARKALKKLGIG